MPEKTNQEKLNELMQLAIAISVTIEKAKALGTSRPMSLVVTKLEEAELWITKEADTLI